MSAMNQEEWAYYSSGFAIGLTVQVAATVPSSNACLAQAASAGDSAFMVYHWYGKYQNEVAKGETGWEADFKKAKFATLTFDYLVRLVEALNGGGCYEFDLTIE